MNKDRLLLVEDDINFGFVLKSYLEIHDFEVTLVFDGKNAFPTFVNNIFDICVLDVMLPNVDGFTIAKEIRKINKKVPIIFLSAKTLKEDVKEGFNVGADDYLTKPFDPEVLLLKIQAILRRKDSRILIENKINLGKFIFDVKQRTLTSPEISYRLTQREADLLKELIINKNNVLDRNYALKKVWGDDSYSNTRNMDVYITKLRKYFKDDNSVQINNVHGSGFILIMDE